MMKPYHLRADNLNPGLSLRWPLMPVRRGLTSVDVETRRLGYTEYGDPAQVVSLVTERIQADLGPGQVRLDGEKNDYVT